MYNSDTVIHKCKRKLYQKQILGHMSLLNPTSLTVNGMVS